MSLIIRSLNRSICVDRSLALSYFAMSMLCFISAVSASQMYFDFWVRWSVHVASHVAVSLWTIPPHAPPPSTGGTGAPLSRLSVTSSGRTRGFHLPRSGWAPLPMNIPGGSAM